MLRLLTSSLLVSLTSASFCGDSAIPYSLEILSNGQPVLGCARPTCFGWAPNGKPASNSGSFFRINNNADGFIRADGFNEIPAYGPADNRYYRPQTAICDHSFLSANCPGLNQWVGGIGPLLNVSQFHTVLQCCTFDGLVQSEDRGLASLHGGQIVVGGEVLSSGRQIAFDYISDLVKVMRADGTLQYDVSIRRMPCPDYAKGTDAAYKLHKPDAAAQAFQAPNLPVEEPLPLPPNGQTQTGNAVLEEVIQEEAVQLPPGTQFQPALQPPPVAFQAPSFVPPPQQPVFYSPPVSYYGAAGQSQFCFTEDMTVELIDGSFKRMDELKTKDWVLSVNEDQLEYVPVEFWLHRVPDQEAEFNEFETEDGQTIKLTDKHYIFKGDCTRTNRRYIPYNQLPRIAVTADQISAGDCVFTIGEDREMHEVRVVRSGRVTQKGIYAPMTTNGRIVVNGIHASCHNIMQAHSVGHSLFAYVGRWYTYCNKLFGSYQEDVVETPHGLTTILQMAEVIFPKNLVTL